MYVAISHRATATVASKFVDFQKISKSQNLGIPPGDSTTGQNVMGLEGGPLVATTRGGI